MQEISDRVAERLKLGESEQPQPRPGVEAAETAGATTNNTIVEKEEGEEEEEEEEEEEQAQDAVTYTPATAALFPELSPGRAMTRKKTVDEVVAELKRSPFFMTELEENDETEALKALAYEGTPLENAAEFKERGNECFASRRWADAKEFYTKGVLILAAEERKRKQAAVAAEAVEAGGKDLPPAAKDGEEGEEKKKEETTEDEIRQERAILESLYANRAACHLELKNYRSCWLDGAAALRLNPGNVKAYYRSARAFLAVGRVAEADDACARGLAAAPDNGPLRGVARDVIGRAEAAAARARREAERAAREKRRAWLVRAALRARAIRTRATAQPPEMEDAAVRLEPDPDDPASHLVFPTVLLYPAHLQSDFVKAFAETDALADHLAYILPPPWDREGAYARPAAVECYMETVTGGLVKIGKKAPLLKILSGGKVEVVDEVVKVFVLPTPLAPAWVEEFKMKKAAERGQR
ncbi:putative tpr repeat protein [Rosellinia necatrix]|uniref:Putative tpr repeat protein n=1 Tax=Rosellinia necatrix TaxID=77044 RepID=A0A1W2TTZ2_ROSNE|nr:putative tpr repeat protein [Rosellinia necatrix]